MDFYQLHNIQRQFVKENKRLDHFVMLGNNKTLISVPHGVSQVRLGKHKYSEEGSLVTGLHLQSKTNCHLIAKTKNNFDDANFDDSSDYKSSVEKLVNEKDIKYIIDLHGMSEKRACDINLGTYLGNNIKTNESLFYKLYEDLRKSGFVVNIDQPFMGGIKTISGSMARKFPYIWTLQIEVNCALTDRIKNFDKYKKLLIILENWINSIT